MFAALRTIKQGLVLVLLSLLLVGCGGGSSGGFVDHDPVLSVTIRTADGSNQVPWNPTLQPSDVRMGHTKTLIVEVRRDGRLFPPSELEVRILGSSSGVLCVPIPGLPQEDTIDTAFDPADVELTAGGPPCGNITLGPLNRVTYREDLVRSTTELFFVSTNRPGTVQILVTARDLPFDEDRPASATQVSTTLTLNVVGQTLPVTSLTLTGPFVNAVREGLMATAITPGEAILQDGSYQRVVSAIATDENGNPPLIGTPIDFYLVDGPLVGYPAEGPGRFAIAGRDGNPEEGTLNFRVPTNPGGNFLGPVMQGPAVRPLNDRLVLDGRQEQNPNGAPNPNNRVFTGLWRVENVINNNWLTIEQDALVANSRQFPPFPLNPAAADTGATVPYIIGSARHATILRTAFTNDTGVASTLLTYPVSRLGQTAVLLACTREQALTTDGTGQFDRRVCGILNTCDANGANCSSVYLPVSDGTNTVLSVNPTEIGPNTTTPVTACLRDPNFTPIPAATINYDISSFLGSASVALDGNPALSGSLQTGANGCVTTQVRSSGQVPGSEPIVISFTANGVETPESVEILGPGASTLIASVESCSGVGLDFSPTPISEDCRCTVGLLLIDDRGGRVSGALINVVSAADIQSVRFLGGSVGTTNNRGEETATVTYRGAPSVEFNSFGATAAVTLPSCGISGTDPDGPALPSASLVGGDITLGAGGSTQVGITLDQVARSNLTINLLATGATGQFTVPATVTIPAGQSSTNFTVAAGSAAPGATLQILLASGVGYAVGASSTISVAVAQGAGPDVPVDSIRLLTSSPQLPSSGLEPVILTAFVRDANNNLIEGARVVFNATQGDGTLLVTRAETDATGTAQAELSVGNNKLNRVITVTATSGDRRDQVNVAVIGTNFVLVSGRTSGTVGEVLNLTIALRDSEGNGIAGQRLNVGFPSGSFLVSDPNPTTDANGRVVVRLRLGAESGNLTLTTSGGLVSGSFPISVSTDNFTFVDPEPLPSTWPDVELGATQTLTVSWTTVGADPDTPNPIIGENVTFATTRGSFVGSNVVMTNVNGEATVTIQAGTAGAGPAVITATATAGDGSPLTATLEILFIATEVRSMTLQADPAVIGPNPFGETDQQSTIIAVLRDSLPGEAGNRVKGKTVNFTLTDVTGGSLSATSAVSDEFGRAVITYTAGTVSSSQNGVIINAVVADAPAVRSEVRLTVARRSLFITLGTGNVMEKPDAVRYIKPYGVLVTDSTGNPVANVNVTLEIWPTHYLKGKWVRLYGVDGFLRWVPVNGDGRDYPLPPDPFDYKPGDPVRCDNLDADGDGISDGQVLIPGNAVTLSTLNVTTDASGFADFNVVYFQQFAQWLDVRLTARARVDGTESREQAFFRLPILGDDITDENVEPPGNPSPFGMDLSCP